MNRKISTKDLSDNAKIIRKELTKKNNKILLAEDLNSLVMNKLGCSKRTAQRTVKELYYASQVTSPIIYRITINS